MIQPRPQRKLPLIPEEYAGKWIAWNHDETRIVASGDTYEECSRSATDAGEQDPIFLRVPDIDELFLGAAP